MNFFVDLVVLLVCLFTFDGGSSQFIGINFLTDSPPPTTAIGDHCLSYKKTQGSCQLLFKCSEIKEKLKRKEVHFMDVACGTQHSNLVCCPKKKDDLAGGIIDISPPKGAYEDCGRQWVDFGDDLRTFNEGNQKADDLKSKGFDIRIRIKRNVDQVTAFAFKFRNSTNQGFRNDEPLNGILVVGGTNAQRRLARYMALIGDDKRWYCDGVLINSQWVLTAAHCFDDQLLTIVRLGEYDHSDSTVSAKEVPVDFSIARIVTHPEYSFPSSYHDLALLKLNKEIPFLRPDLQHVCLPWGEESKHNLIGETVTLTGWGANIFLGPSTPILQEVNVTVFDPSKCDKSYSTLQGHAKKFPNGIRKETSLCAGDEQGGKDACQGDSGGPIVYRDKNGRYTLAGIVSTGNGCGLKEFPGIYVPMHNSKYLSWIKQVAF